jgi:hypothetical protein
MNHSSVYSRNMGPRSAAKNRVVGLRFSVLFLSLLGLLQVANAQRAIVSLGSKLKRFGGKKSDPKATTNGNYILEGENDNISYYLAMFQDSTKDYWMAWALLLSCVVLSTIYMAASSATTAQDGEGECMGKYILY